MRRREPPPPADSEGGVPEWVLTRGPSPRHFRSLADDPPPREWSDSDWLTVRATRRWLDEVRAWRERHQVSYAELEKLRTDRHEVCG